MALMDDNYKNLANAIVEQAVEDYVNAIINDNDSKIDEIERFFKSKWFIMLNQIGIDSDKLIEKLKTGAEEFKIFSKCAFEHGFISESKGRKKLNRVFECPICGGNVFSYWRRYKKGTTLYICKCETCNANSHLGYKKT